MEAADAGIINHFQNNLVVKAEFKVPLTAPGL
jgi:hypothetical protein